MQNKVIRQIVAQEVESAAGYKALIVTMLGSLALAAGLLSAGLGAQESTLPEPATESESSQVAAPEREEEAPLEVNPTARPTMDYIPSETISEDSSVSFPVDI
ncbi:MAG: hypothetical protein EBY62_03855 [Cellvibrionales bacterium]|jgi:NADH:ubiquinone oxidoreductase subunit 5 (subunit L)/multisubunit Na+/H+ antiporter MnhA subunit|nr:hypothetical protein [Cellvibrionales bacterium]